MSVEYKDYYQVLDVPRTASKEDIAKAYKKLARKHHPDLNPGDSAAEERFKDINEAYEVLKDDEKRRMYDQLGPNWKHGQQFQGAPGFENMHFNFNGQNFGGGGDFSDFFETLFGQARGSGNDGFGADPFGNFQSRSRNSRHSRGRDVEAELEITLEEASKGGEKSFSLSGPDGPRTLRVNIPAGFRDGGKLRLAGQGRPGSPAGDLFLTIRYAPHLLFQVDGDNILCDVEISPWEAVLGTVARVPTLDASVEMRIPPGSSSGRKLRLRGRGLGPAASRGDELVRIAIRTPDPASLSPRQKELWEELAKESEAQRS